LPYWINNFKEKECDDNRAAMFIGLYPGVTTLEPTPPPPVPPVVGTPPADIVAGKNVSPEEAQAITDKLIADQTAAWKAQLQTFFTGLATDEEKRQAGCNWYETMGAGDVCAVGGWKLWAVGIAGAAAALYFTAGRH
jgi:hypothetical protein